MVYDYVAGIADWKAAGLPVEGEAPAVQRVSDSTRPDIPTCTPGELLGDVRRRTFDAAWDECVVIDCDTLVLGRLRSDAWETEGHSRVGDVMELGPTTVRPNGLLQPLVDRMAKRGTRLVIVTDPQGQLIGVLLREEAERLLRGEPPDQIWQDCEGCPGQWRVVSSTS
ncbi:MAG: CBS domain-containing protein [Acidimicrobiia bacterium]